MSSKLFDQQHQLHARGWRLDLTDGVYSMVRMGLEPRPETRELVGRTLHEALDEALQQI